MTDRNSRQTSINVPRIAAHSLGLRPRRTG